jgi:hypothetical protein
MGNRIQCAENVKPLSACRRFHKEARKRPQNAEKRSKYEVRSIDKKKGPSSLVGLFEAWI